LKILVTGAAGFIGFHTSRALLAAGHEVLGIDNLNAYYDPRLKQARLDQLLADEKFQFHKLDLADTDDVLAVTAPWKPDAICHLAAQAGVRYSIDAPFAYARSNLLGHLTILELARTLGEGLRHLVYASSSSVYGEQSEVPFREENASEAPESLYAATKRSDELMTAAYSNLYAIPATGLRFFTVYGPWGRPDMAYWLFAERMMRGEAIKVFNHGEMERDFTYIDDIVQPLVRIIDDAPERGRHEVYNIGGSSPVKLMDMISSLEQAFGLEAVKEMLPMQPGDVTRTYANVDKLVRDYGYRPGISLDSGLRWFADWFRTWSAS